MLLHPTGWVFLGLCVSFTLHHPKGYLRYLISDLCSIWKHVPGFMIHQVVRVILYNSTVMGVEIVFVLINRIFVEAWEMRRTKGHTRFGR